MSLFSHIRKSGATYSSIQSNSPYCHYYLFRTNDGSIDKLLDIYTTNLGNIFSQVSVWIFLCIIDFRI